VRESVRGVKATGVKAEVAVAQQRVATERIRIMTTRDMAITTSNYRYWGYDKCLHILLGVSLVGFHINIAILKSGLLVFIIYKVMH